MQIAVNVSVTDAVQKLETASAVLQEWKRKYYATRERLTQSRNRWEFSRARLFDTTDYMASICDDLRNMVLVVNDFSKFLGPELKAVTGNAEGIDSVRAKVDEMYRGIETLPFHIFNKENQELWEAAKAQFQADNAEIERATKHLIDISFKKLRSAEAAFELLQNFKSIKMAGAVNKQMLAKFNDILLQFSKEIDTTRAMFNQHRDAPPITRNQPRVAGSIKWSRSLFARIKKTMSKLHVLDGDMDAQELAKDVRAKYIAVAKSMMHYENGLFNGWKEAVSTAAKRHLNQPILKTLEDGKIIVNFDPELSLITRETRYLDRLGFQLPEIALNIALKESKYLAKVSALETMLQMYETNTKLDPMEHQLLATKLKHLQARLDMGFSILNWNSLGIEDFIKEIREDIKKFGSTVDEVRKKAKDILQEVERIALTDLIGDPAPKGTEMLDLVGFVEALERRKNGIIETLRSKYDSGIPAYLQQIAEQVLPKEELRATAIPQENHSKALRRHPLLREYYYYWEKLIFAALTTMVIRAMDSLRDLFVSKGRPLFRVELSLAKPDILVNPTVGEVGKILQKVIHLPSLCTKSFRRWEDGSCNPCRDIYPHGMENDPLTYTFYDQMKRHPDVIRRMLSLSRLVEKTVKQISQYEASWLDPQVSMIWKDDRVQMTDNFLQKKPTNAELEKVLSKYRKMAEDFQGDVLVLKRGFRLDVRGCTCDFIYVSAARLAAGVREEVQEWLQYTIEATAAIDAQRRQDKLDQIDAYFGQISQRPEDIDELKAVLNAVSIIRSSALQMELDYSSLEERFRLRVLFSPESERARWEKELQDVMVVKQRWAELQEEADFVDWSLSDIKKEFANETEVVTGAFVDETQQLLEELLKEGPGVQGTELDDGLELLGQFEQRVAALVKRKEELMTAERLFSLPITSYPALGKALDELARQREVYNVYGEHQENVRQWSGMLWAELDISKMVSGTEETLQKLRKMKHLKGIPTYESVESTISGFADSLPLMGNLKSPALRPRHWKALMQVTGSEFDMDPKTFTLGSMFQLQLHRYADEINVIVNKADKELTIDHELGKVEAVWKEQVRSSIRYPCPESTCRHRTLKSSSAMDALILFSSPPSAVFRPLQVRQERRGPRLGPALCGAHHDAPGGHAHEPPEHDGLPPRGAFPEHRAGVGEEALADRGVDRRLDARPAQVDLPREHLRLG